MSAVVLPRYYTLEMCLVASDIWLHAGKSIHYPSEQT